jgi:hypothetical protein
MYLSTIIFLATSDKTSYSDNGDNGGTFSDHGNNANENGSGDGTNDNEDSISVGVDAS